MADDHPSRWSGDDESADAGDEIEGIELPPLDLPGGGLAQLQVSTLLLCDFAQVRENLLFVNSGGVSRVVSAKFPANLRLHLALIVHVPAVAIGRGHNVRVRLTYPDTVETIASVDVGVQVNQARGVYPGEGLNLPRVIDLSVIPFPRPGQVDIRVSVDDEPAGDLSFWLLQQREQAAPS